MKTGDIPATDKALFKCPEPKVDIIESNVQARISDYDPDKTIDSKNADFFYVNGIQTTPEDAEHTSGILSGIMDKGVKNIWSEKKSCLVNDLIKAVKIDQQNSTGTISTQTASEICDNVLKSLKSGKNVKLIAHSRGGSEVANALWETHSCLAAFGGYSTEQINKMMQKVEVITMGGLASPSHFPYDIKLTQIRNPKDPVPELNENMGNIRPRYSRTEIQKAVDEKIKGSPLTKDELAAVYQKNVDAGGLVTHLYNVKEKLAYGVNVLGKETATVATVAGGVFGARVLMGVIPKNAIVLGQAVSQSMSNFAYRAGINISVSG